MKDLLNIFTNNTDWRDIYKKPYRLNEYAVGVSGRRVAFTALCDEHAQLDDCPENYSNYTYAFASAFDESKLERIEIDFPDKTQCNRCADDGTVCEIDCTECCGHGSVDVANEYNTYSDLECKSCIGSGVVSLKAGEPRKPCPTCAGKKEYHKVEHVITIKGWKIRAADLSDFYDDQTLLYFDTTDKYLYFKQGDYFGLIMVAY